MKDYEAVRKWVWQGSNLIIRKQPLHALVWIYSVLTPRVLRGPSYLGGDSYRWRWRGQRPHKVSAAMIRTAASSTSGLCVDIMYITFSVLFKFH